MLHSSLAKHHTLLRLLNTASTQHTHYSEAYSCTRTLSSQQVTPRNWISYLSVTELKCINLFLLSGYPSNKRYSDSQHSVRSRKSGYYQECVNTQESYHLGKDQDYQKNPKPWNQYLHHLRTPLLLLCWKQGFDGHNPHSPLSFERFNTFLEEILHNTLLVWNCKKLRINGKLIYHNINIVLSIRRFIMERLNNWLTTNGGQYNQIRN